MDCKVFWLRESSFNMTRKGDEDIEGGGEGLKNLYTSKPTGEGRALKKLDRYRRGLLKFQASSFNIFIRAPLVI